MQIQLNGKSVDITAEDIGMLKKFYSKDSKEIVVIINGYQTDDNKRLHENDSIILIEKGKMPDVQCLKAMMAARHTPGVLEKLEKAKVGIAGLGGLGSQIALALARSGVGYLHLVDYDEVEPSNLNRQAYRIKDLGRYKTEALKEIIKDINPFINVKITTEKVTVDNAAGIFSDDAVVCEAFDQADSKSMLVNTLLEKNKKVILVAASGMAGYGNCNAIRTRKITDRFYLCGDGITEAKEGCGLMAPRVMVCAGHQADMVIDILLKNTMEE